jgi:uncharacterized protein (DUF2249 family)
MADDLADLNKHLARLLQQAMKETDPVEYDKLGAEIWRVLREQERLSDSLKQTVSSARRLTCSLQGQAAKTHG